MTEWGSCTVSAHRFLRRNQAGLLLCADEPKFGCSRTGAFFRFASVSVVLGSSSSLMWNDGSVRCQSRWSAFRVRVADLFRMPLKKLVPGRFQTGNPGYGLRNAGPLGLRRGAGAAQQITPKSHTDTHSAGVHASARTHAQMYLRRQRRGSRARGVMSTLACSLTRIRKCARQQNG